MMNVFRKYKTVDELLSGFLLEKEIGIQHKSFAAYACHLQIFINWLKEHKLNNVVLRKITPETHRNNKQ